MGRPIEFNNSVTERAKEYLSQCVDTVDPDFPNRLKVEIPSLEGLASFLEIDRSTLYDWKTKYGEFSYIVNEVMQEQAKRLFSNGLSGAYNASIAKLMLTKHGYSEKQEIEHSGTQTTIHKIERVIVK